MQLEPASAIAVCSARQVDLRHRGGLVHTYRGAVCRDGVDPHVTQHLQLPNRAFSAPPSHTASATLTRLSHLKYVSEHGVLGLHVGLVVRAEAGEVEVVARVDLRTRMEAQDVSPRTQSERHNHTTPARKPARLATLREYGAERHELRSLRRRAHRAPILPRA